MRALPILAAFAAAASLAGCMAFTPPAANTPPPASFSTPAPSPGQITAGVVGGSIGLSLSTEDRNRALAAEYRALQSSFVGVPVMWRGESPSVYGEVIAGAIYTVNQYQCREYSHVIYVNGAREPGRGTACRTGDGPWSPVI